MNDKRKNNSASPNIQRFSEENSDKDLKEYLMNNYVSKSPLIISKKSVFSNNNAKRDIKSKINNVILKEYELLERHKIKLSNLI